MFKSLSPSKRRVCLRDASESPMSDPEVAYPDWYLQRWHFLPEGYLSRRGARLYPTYILPLYNQCRPAALFSRVAEVLAETSPSRVLELGCGPGTLLEMLHKRLPGSHLTGLDLSPFFLEMAHDRPALRTASVELIHGNVTGLRWTTGDFDAACAVHVFGHMPREAAESSRAEAVRVLAPGGRLLVVDHAWHPWTLPPSSRLLWDKPFNLGLIRLRLLERT